MLRLRVPKGQLGVAVRSGAILLSDIEICYGQIAGVSPVSPTVMSAEVFARSLQTSLSGEAIDVFALNELGRKLFLMGATEHARACYALAAEDSRALGAKVNLGRCELRLGRPDIAEGLARDVLLGRADFGPALLLLSDVLAAQTRLDEAIDAMRRAILHSPSQFSLHLQLGEMYERSKDIELAAIAYWQAHLLNPSDLRSLYLLIFAKRCLCDWQALDALSGEMAKGVASGSTDISPFEFLAEDASAEQQLLVARSRARAISAATRSAVVSANPRTVVDSGRLRVGFVSYGFGAHPTTLLTTSLFEQLRSSALEVHLFSTRSPADSPQRRRIAAAAHIFHDVSTMSTQAIATQVREMGIDILVDLDGYSRSRSPGVFAHRSAPVQVSWLAYPGTTGADYMDYVIADRFVLPEPLEPFFSEKAAYLPRCYLCSDTSRILPEPPSREACGLPPEGIVYVCFNASFKINHRSFDRMMRVLAQVPGSVLWLLKGPGHADERLIQAAASRDIDRSRLVFMDRLSHLAYLSRYRHADLFLDTEYYNAHTVASDALWAGCPLLTRPGETFASRVAGSLNHHSGMDELNVDNDEAFVALGVRYGLDTSYRTNIRQRLARQIKESGHFDTAAYARDFASLLTRMAAHRRNGGTPGTFPNDAVG